MESDKDKCCCCILLGKVMAKRLQLKWLPGTKGVWYVLIFMNRPCFWTPVADQTLIHLFISTVLARHSVALIMFRSAFVNVDVCLP